MALHHLTADWTKIANKGDMVQIINTGPVAVLYTTLPIAKAGSAVLPGGRYSGQGLRSDLYARSDAAGAEVVVNAKPLYDAHRY